MGSCSGNSSSGTMNSAQIVNSSCEEDQPVMVVIDERKRKRMLSNRESARRSRMRKQKHLDDLMAQVAQLKRENSQIMSTISVTTQEYLNVEAENSVLRAQMIELSQRLESLDEILNLLRSFNGVGCGGGCPTQVECMGGGEVGFMESGNPWNMNMMNMAHPNQPIIASAAADVFQCW